VVIDSPNQGAQDRPHLQGLLTSIASTAPADAQVILAHEEVAEQFGADLVIEFPAGVRLLSREKFTVVAPQMFDYIAQARGLLANIAGAIDSSYALGA
jgi:hypothetical protein